MQVHRHSTPAALVEATAASFLEVLCEVQAQGRIPRVVLTGGTIADAFHRRVAELAASSSVDFGAVEWWWGDERFVAADSEDRNAGQARRALLAHVGVQESRVHEMPAADGSLTLTEAAHLVDAELTEHLAGEPFDLVMLGIGPDAHVASLFPGHPALSAQGAAVPVPDSPKPPPARISLTYPRLRASDRLWILASGESKQQAVTALLAPTGTVHDTPARGVVGPTTTLWTDLP